MILRAANERDIAPIAQIIGDWRADTPYIPPLHTRDEDRQFIAGLVAAQDVVVAEKDEAVQGFIARDGVEIGQLYLALHARGQGLGTALLDHMKGQSDHLELWCFQANTGARRFYERHGFFAERLTDGADNAEQQPDIRYVWRAGS
ncbi:MAG: GNAT family N-acetyltransferase [Pseudomonadota bacterium]